MFKSALLQLENIKAGESGLTAMFNVCRSVWSYIMVSYSRDEQNITRENNLPDYEITDLDSYTVSVFM